MRNSDIHNQDIASVLFDLDGTLIDTAPDFIRIVKKICDEQGVPTPSDERIREQVSAGSLAMVRLIDETADLNNPSVQAKFEDFRKQFLAEYEHNICVDTCLYDGMEQVLETLEKLQIPWGIVTNKPRVLSELLLQALDLTERCAVLVCPDDVVHAKPHPEPMYLAANTLHVDCAKTVYIGDHPRDIEAGNSANMITVFAQYGYLPPVQQADGSHRPMNVTLDHDVIESWKADHTIEKAVDLIDLLNMEHEQ